MVTSQVDTEILFHVQQDVAKIAELTELVLPVPLPSWDDFSSVVLHPLRVQMMGSVVVSIIIQAAKLN